MECNFDYICVINRLIQIKRN